MVSWLCSSEIHKSLKYLDQYEKQYIKKSKHFALDWRQLSKSEAKTSCWFQGGGLQITPVFFYFSYMFDFICCTWNEIDDLITFDLMLMFYSLV